jgi:aliphatic nitrilase
MLKLAKFKAATVQASPAFLDPHATVAKAAALIREAAGNGARLVAFPEVFVPGYPYWNWITDPVTGSAWFEKLAKASVLVPGPEIDVLRHAARDTGSYVVIGVNERSAVSVGTIFNTLVFIGPDGALLGKHRKLVPTWAEKLTWTNGDGSSLKVYETAIGPLGCARLRREYKYAGPLQPARAGRTRACGKLYFLAGCAARI